MNVLFLVVSGAERAVSLCITLAAVYAVWLGILQVAEDAGALRGLARGMKPLTKKLFRTENESALEKIVVNLSANLLGMGGAATPAGISAMRLLGAEENARYSRAMLFAVNCAGLQLFPTTVVSLRGCGVRVRRGSAYPPFVIVRAHYGRVPCDASVRKGSANGQGGNAQRGK